MSHSDCISISVSFCSNLQDEASQQLKQAARDMLGRLGSAHARTITWRDMWAMIAVKQGKEKRLFLQKHYEFLTIQYFFLIL